jgi:hypothetical protein
LLDVAHNAEEWAMLLAEVGIEQIDGPADLAKVNGHLTLCEKQMQRTA